MERFYGSPMKVEIEASAAANFIVYLFHVV
jgi:hypothetical protein